MITRLEIHKRWNRKFLQEQLDMRVTEYARLDEERFAAGMAFNAEVLLDVEQYAAGNVDSDLGKSCQRLMYLGRRVLRKALSDVYARREGASPASVHLGAWHMLLGHLLWGGYRRAALDQAPDVPLLKLSDFTENFSRAQSLGWHAQADKLHELVFGIEPVSTLWHRDAFDPRWVPAREPWGRFTLSLCSQFYGHELPPTPGHPYASPAFDELLACWRDPDPAALADPLLAVCDWHTHECMYSRSDDPDRNVDFIDDTLMGWPVEVHTVFRLRERLGLALPAVPDHPLMHTTPMGPYLPPQPVPVDDLMQRFIERACAEVKGLREVLGSALPGVALPAATPSSPPRPATSWPAPGPAPQPQVERPAFETGVSSAGQGFELEELEPSAIDELRTLAGEARRMAAEAFGVQLDGSVASLEALDQVLDRLAEVVKAQAVSHDDPELMRWMMPFAAYLGEVFCADQGARWRMAILPPRQVPCVSASTGSKPTLFPLDRVARRLLIGPQYRVVPQYAEAARMASGGPSAP